MIDEHWLHDTMKMTSKVACGFAKRPAYKHWVPKGSLQLIEALRSALSDHELGGKCCYVMKLCKACVSTGKSDSQNRLNVAAASSNYQRLLQLIQITGGKMSGVSETIYEDDKTSITNIYRRLYDEQSFSKSRSVGLLPRRHRPGCRALKSQCQLIYSLR